MHKKYIKFNHKDHHRHGSKRGHVKNKKETDDSILEIKVPPNSKNELGKKLGLGDYEENLKHNKHKHKHNREESKSNDRHQKSKHEKKVPTDVPFHLDKEPVKHKERKEKRDKERLNKIEKYLEGLNKISDKKPPRNRSLDSSESVLKEKHTKRGDKLKRTNSYMNNTDGNNFQIITTTKERKLSKKHKHKESKKRESSKEKNTMDDQKPVLYCEVELQNPFSNKKKKYVVENIYPEIPSKSKEQSPKRRSPSRDNLSLPPIESTSTHGRIKEKRPKEKKIPIKFSPRRSKMKADFRSHKDQRSNASLESNKYLAAEKKLHRETEANRQKKKRHRKIESTTKISRKEKEGKIKPEKSKKNQEKASSNSDQYKAKIEDDIKSYFSKIQSLIDKKLDFILGNSNSKETKSNSIENGNKAEKVKDKKEKKMNREEKRDRSHSKKRKKAERNKSVDDEKKEEDTVRVKHDQEKKSVRESRRKDTSASNLLKRERYPSEGARNYARHESPQRRHYEDHLKDVPPNDKQERQRHKSPCGERSEYKMRPDRLIKMLEHPSTFSVQSNTSVPKEKVDEIKRISSNNAEDYQKRDRSLSKRNAVSNEINLNTDLEQACVQEFYAKPLKKHVEDHPITFSMRSNTSLFHETTNGAKRKCDNFSEHHDNELRHKMDRTLTRRDVMPGEDDFKIEEIERAFLRASKKKMKKRMRQLMNLECKTISIVGIPSQMRESAIINETQTTTSLNAFTPKEDFVEQKKKSKRFKLYYKYSVADNKCAPGSDKSSEEKKSIVSDSYRIVSDPSDQNIDVWEELNDEPKEVIKEPDSEREKILFIMKKEKMQKTCDDTTRHRAVVQHTSKKHNKRDDSPKAITLNNILEEPSNISLAIHNNEDELFLKEDIDCTFFKPLKSSSSDCNLELFQKSKRDDSNSPHKHKNRRVAQSLKENVIRPKSPSRKSHEKHRQYEFNVDKKPKCEEKRECNKKIRKIGSHQRIKNKRNRDMYKYTSKSDINISYDSLRKYKFNKGRHKSDAPSQFRDQLKQILPDMFMQKLCPESKDISLIIKEELREILKEIPRNVVCKESSFDDRKPAETKPVDKDAEEAKDCKELDEKPKAQDTEEKKYCSKKIGTHQATTRIPSLIKGYIGTTSSQITKAETVENDVSTNQVNLDEVSENIVIEQSENNLVDVATEISINAGKLEVPEKTDITLENKKSQTPSYLDPPITVTVCDPKQCRHPKKIITASSTKRCQLVDPYIDTKIGCVSKTTRPIINLENNHFPNRRIHESESSKRPASAQLRRQKSSISEGKSVKFENKEESQSNIPNKFMGKRPATAGERYKEHTKTPLAKSRQIPTKPSLTISTNVMTISTSTYKEKSTDAQSTGSKNLKNNQNQTKEYVLDENAIVTCLQRNRTRSNLSSKSALSLNDQHTESKIGSLVCVDRFNNIQRINLRSNSNSRSLDRYATKSIITDNPNPSRLFLTKSFNPQMNTYQRRKMYDESIRKKLKKKNVTQDQMGPRVFEVRYLTLENKNLNEACGGKGNFTPIVNQKFISKLPTFSTKINRVKQRTKPSIKKSRRNFPKNKEDACKFSGRDIFQPVISDVDQLNRYRRKKFPEKKVEDILANDNTPDQEKTTPSDVMSSSVTPKDTILDSQHNKVDDVGAEQNFKDLIDTLYDSIISYCNTKFKLPQEKNSKSQQIAKDVQSSLEPPPVNEKSYVIFPKPSGDSAPQPNDPSSKDNSFSEEKRRKLPENLICSHLSCPVLAGSTSSFDYLYEDGPIDLNKDAVLLHFRKPMKTILGYALNDTKHIHKEKIRRVSRKQDQISNCATGSEESGYSSNNSKKCTLVCSFFKRPSIANLFKPVKKLEACQSTSSINESRSGPNLQEYNIMNQKCIEYAEKVRLQAQNKDKPEETFQEVPLDVLLLCRKSSTVLSDYNSNCSLCKRYSNTDLPDITEGDELSNNTDYLEVKNIEDIKLTEENNNVQKETLIFYEDSDHRPSLEIITLQKSQISLSNDETSKLVQEMCPVVLSITNLNSCCLTIVEQPKANQNFSLGHHQDENIPIALNEQNNADHTSLKSSKSDPKSIDLDGKSDISSTFGFRYTNSIQSKFMAKRFFQNLLKVYEKEIDVTSKLFRDDNFFVNVLLESVKSLGVQSKTKNVKLKNLIKGKIKNCIENVFSTKNCISSQSGDTDPQTLCGSGNNHQRKLQILAGDARKYFSMFVQAVKTNKDINDEVKICGLLKLLERIEDGDFAILRKKEEVDFEEEIKEQVKEAFVNIYQISVKEAKKRKRSLTTDDLKLIRSFVSKYRVGLLSKTDLIATYIGRGVFKSEGHLKAAVTYLIQQNRNKDIDLRDFDEHCKIITKCSG